MLKLELSKEEIEAVHSSVKGKVYKLRALKKRGLNKEHWKRLDAYESVLKKLINLTEPVVAQKE